MLGQRDDWNQHWERYAESAEDNPAQLYRRRLVTSRLALGSKARILDVGSGQGDLAATLRAAAPDAEIVGLELSETGVRVATEKVPSARFYTVDLVDRPELPVGLEGWATHAVCSEVLEHVDRTDVLLANASRYLAPGCRLVVTVPGGPRSAFDRYIGHRRHYTVDQAAALLSDAGFLVRSAVGAGFPFFNLYRLLVVLRGDRLVEDVAQGSGSSSLLARMVMSAFRFLFRFNLNRSRWGWQVVVTADWPGDGART